MTLLLIGNGNLGLISPSCARYLESLELNPQQEFLLCDPHVQSDCIDFSGLTFLARDQEE